MTTNNLALGKPAAQSSNRAGVYGALKAVDGSRRTSMAAHSCTQTLNEIGSWWLVNLEATYEIKEVVITNSADRSGKLIYVDHTNIACWYGVWSSDASARPVINLCTCSGSAWSIACIYIVVIQAQTELVTNVPAAPKLTAHFTTSWLMQYAF